MIIRLNESANNDSLYQKALAAYDADDSYFFEDLSTRELIRLWQYCKITSENPGGAPFDDEVYDELSYRGYDFKTGFIGGVSDIERYTKVCNETDNFTKSEGSIACVNEYDIVEVGNLLLKNGYERVETSLVNGTYICNYR